MYCPSGFLDSEDGCGNVIEGSWRGEDSSTALQPLRQLGGNRYTGTAYATRVTSNNFFISSAGEVCWQNQHVNHTN